VEVQLDEDDTKDQVARKKEIDKRLKRLHQMRDLYRTLNSEKRFMKNFRYNDKLGQQDEHQVGDLVWLYREQQNLVQHGVSKKYQLNKVGPMTIVSKSKHSDTYVVTDTKTGYHNQVHSKFLSPFGKFYTLPQPEEVEQDEVKDEEESSSSDIDRDDDADVSKSNILEGKRNRRSVHFGPCVSH
jgi:hypothetical protein